MAQLCSPMTRLCQCTVRGRCPQRPQPTLSQHYTVTWQRREPLPLGKRPSSSVAIGEGKSVPASQGPANIIYVVNTMNDKSCEPITSSNLISMAKEYHMLKDSMKSSCRVKAATNTLPVAEKEKQKILRRHEKLVASHRDSREFPLF